MAKVYAKVSVEMYGDQRFRALSPVRPSGQSLWIYLLTGDFRTRIPGLNLRVGIGGLADRLQWRQSDVLKHWAEIVSQGMAAADWHAGVVWLPKGIVHNVPESPNVVIGWGAVTLPECYLITSAKRALRGYLTAHLPESYVKAFDKTFGEGSPDGFPQDSPNQEHEQDLRHPQTPAERGQKATRKEKAQAEDIWRGNSGRCPHVNEGDSECPSKVFCLGRIVQRLRDNEAAGMRLETAS